MLTPAGELSVYDLQTKELQRVIVPGHPAHSLRLSPSGTSVALGCGNILEVWDLTSHAERAALTLTNEIWHLAWQPGEERLAIGCYGGLYLWDIGAPEAVRLPERAPVAITELSFDGDGGFLFSGGWFELGEVWDVRQLQRVLEPGAGHLVQLSQDQRRLAIGRERVGYGIRQFLPPGDSILAGTGFVGKGWQRGGPGSSRALALDGTYPGLAAARRRLGSGARARTL